ncbi:MAG: hypothetical protein LBS01_04295 [Prevotellaceae bacterium]|jgi:hypothetical protein|nr:hypothetical protein [Prevotellaceae bacterium]
MTTYQSNFKPVDKSSAEVFAAFSDLTKLEKMREKITESGQVQDFSLSENELSFSAAMAGKITLRIAERIPNEKIAFTLQSVLNDADLQLNIKETSPATSEIALVMDADLPPMIKMMLGNKLAEGLDKMAEAIAKGLK